MSLQSVSSSKKIIINEPIFRVLIFPAGLHSVLHSASAAVSHLGRYRPQGTSLFSQMETRGEISIISNQSEVGESCRARDREAT